MLSDLLLTFGVFFLFAIVGGIIASKTRQPLVVSLLLVGTLIGPFALNLVSDRSLIEVVIELGSILFLFVIGLEFSAERLVKMGVKTLLVAFLKMGVMFFIGSGVAILLGLGMTAAVFIGTIMAFSSTMISLNILRERSLSRRPELPLLVAILIIEDLAGVGALTFFHAAAETSANLPLELASLFFNLCIMVGIFLVLSRYAEPVIRWALTMAGEEMIIFMGLSLCAGFAFLATLLNLSPGVGAFLAGSIVATCRDSKSFLRVTTPYSYMFTALFFLGNGALIDIGAIFQSAHLILILLAVYIVGIFLSVGLPARLFAGLSEGSAIFSSVAMMPMGAFSLLIARASIPFDLGIDLPTITSTLILALALITSFGIRYHQWLTDVVQPRLKGLRLGLVANFVTTLLAELQLESSHSRHVTRASIRTSCWLLAVTAAIALALQLGYRVNPWLGLGVGLLLAGAAGWQTYLAAADTSDATIRLLATMNIKHSVARRVLHSLFLTLLFLSIGLFSPVLWYLLGLSGWFLLISFAIVGLAGFYAWSVGHNLRRVTFEYKYGIPTYKRFTREHLRVPGLAQK